MMRAFAYALAALAAVGIVIVLSTTPEEQASSASSVGPADPAATVVAAEDQRVMDQAGTLTLHVPEMHCPFACYPAVKESLESDGAVSEVELTEQAEEGVIDNPQVIVRYDRGFNVDAAIDALAQQGFTDSDLAP